VHLDTSALEGDFDELVALGAANRQSHKRAGRTPHLFDGRSHVGADGLAVDAQGFVWSAQWYAGEVLRYDPDGRVERRLAVPAQQVSSVAFGGPELDEIYVTSMARVRHPAVHEHFARQVKPQFGAGSLFRIRGLGIKGLPEPRFGG